MTLHSETAGHGPHMLLIHGWGMHSGFWNGCMQGLQRDFTTTLLDLPGHGYSPRAGDSAALTTLASAVAGFLRNETTLVGWSLGGLVALELARRFPGQVQRLIMVSGTARFCTAPDWPHAMATDTFAAFAQLLEQDTGRTLQRFLALQAHGTNDPRHTTRALQTLLASRPMAQCKSLREGLALLRDSDLRADLGGIACPTLFIHGENDAIIPWQAAKACGRLLPDAQVHRIENAGHVPFVTHRDEFVRVVRAFCHEH